MTTDAEKARRFVTLPQDVQVRTVTAAELAALIAKARNAEKPAK